MSDDRPPDHSGEPRRGPPIHLWTHPAANERETDPVETHVENESPEVIARRPALVRATLLLGGVMSALVVVPPLAFLLAPLVQRVTEEWRDLGPVSAFPMGQIKLASFEEVSPLPWAGQTAHTAAWVSRAGDADFTVFAINCSHLGCPVNWLESARLFLCPCHGGAYYVDGSVAAGPPPRPLTRLQHRVENGVLQVLTSPLPATQPRRSSGGGA